MLPLQAHPGHADGCRHRRFHHHDRHGRGRQHPHLRAHEGGAASRHAASGMPCMKASPARGRPSAIPTSPRIITGVILYYFGSTSIVTGFALVFVIGVLVSMFTAITASRASSSTQWLRANTASSRRFLSVTDSISNKSNNVKIKSNNRKIFYTVSGILVVACIPGL